ncbi:unnamed protein product, partial [Symbiodinium sp. KB8]
YCQVGKPSEVKMIEEEISYLRKLRHPRLVSFLGFAKDAGQVIIVMEFMSGGSLSHILFTKKMTLSFDRKCVMAHQMAEGLAFLHDLSVVHRDLKTANVILDDDLNCKICDFGLTITLDRTHMTVWGLQGSPRYMAPEQLDASDHKPTRITEKVDIWQMGCVLMELWRRKAELMLLALPNTYTKERWGAKLLEFVAGEAEEVCEALPLEKITKEGGHTLILEALDERYKELQKEALHNHLQEYFYGMQIRPGETYRNLEVRLQTAYRRLQEHAIELPPEVRGWFLMRKLQLDASAEALVMTHTKGSLKHEEVTRAIQAIFPQGVAKNVHGKTKEVFEADDHGGTVDAEETAEDVFQAVADQVQSADEYDDEDALDVFETYKEVRKRVQQKKLGRGYKNDESNQWKLSGTVRGKVELLKSKTKCHLCHERGHWKRECPRRGQGGSGRQTRASGSKEAMVADDGVDGYKDIEYEHFLDVDEIGKFEIFLAERGDQVEVVLASQQEAMCETGEVSGDFERSLSEFLNHSGAEDMRADEVYMSECKQLAIKAAVLPGKYRVRVKLRETERGHYAIPLFEGMQKCRAELQEVSNVLSVLPPSMSYTGQAMSDTPMMGHGQSQLIMELMVEVANQAAASDGQLTDVSAKILDEAADLSEDELDATVPGIDGSLGQRIFNIGKFQKSGQLMTFKVAYEQDKKYVAWVRKFIKGKNPDPSKTNHPTMSQFRLYIALRDQRKSLRLQMNPELSVQPQGPSPSVMSARPKVRAATGQQQPKARATVGAQRRVPMTSGAMSAASSARMPHPPATASQSSTGWEDQWVVATEPESETATETVQERRRRAIREQIELLTFQLEAMQEEAEDL